MIDRLAIPQPEFAVIQEYKHASLKEMHEGVNMGQGFAVIVGEGDGVAVVQHFRRHGHEAWVAGRVEASDQAKVTLTEEDIVWTEVA